MNSPTGGTPTSFNLLFLCTGNYYRSRFAEMLFNFLATEAGINWRATSRGIAVDLGISNIGAISADAISGLAARNIFIGGNTRFPIQLEEKDLEEADLIIGLKEAEHRPLLEERFPAWPDKVEYWQIDDLNIAAVEDTLTHIDEEVKRLILRLS